MSRRANLLASLGLLAAVLVACPTRADASWGGVFDLEFGLKGMGGYDHWTKPDDGPYEVLHQDVAFSNDRGGYGAGGGLYIQMRFFKYLGLEIDFLFEDDLLWEHPLDGYDWKTTARRVNMRLPILVQAVLPTRTVRIAVGIGPEFVIPLKTWAEQSSVDELPVALRDFKFGADAKTTTRLTFGLNIAIKLWRGITLPLDLRASYDPAQPDAWTDRVSVPASCAAGQWSACGRDVYDPAIGYKVHQRNDWDFRLLLGLGFDFPAMLGK